MADTPLQSASDRMLRLIRKRAEWHLIESAAATLEDALTISRRGKGRPSTIDKGRIRTLLADGKTPAEVAAETGASAATISRVRRGM